MGQEFGQLSEWSEERGLDWWILDQPTHAQLARLRRRSSTASTATTPRSGQLDNDAAGFEWLEGGAAEPRTSSRSSPRRHGNTDRASCELRRRARTTDYRSACPIAGRWREVLNSDAAELRRVGRRQPRRRRRDGRRSGARRWSLPPLGALWLALDPQRTSRRRSRADRCGERAGRGSERPARLRVRTAGSRAGRAPRTRAGRRRRRPRRARGGARAPVLRSSASSAGTGRAADRTRRRRARRRGRGRPRRAARSRSSGAAAAAARTRPRSSPCRRSSRLTCARPASRVGVARVLGDRASRRRMPRRVVAALDRVVGLVVQRRQRLLDRLRPWPSASPPRRPGRAGDAVLRGELRAAGRRPRAPALGHRAGEQRHRLAGDHGDDRAGSTARGRPATAAGSRRRRPWPSTSRPPSSATTFSRIGLSCLHGSHHSAHRSTTTGTVLESSSTCANVSSVASKTSDGAADRLPGSASGRRRRGRSRRDERSTAPRRTAPGAVSLTSSPPWH